MHQLSSSMFRLIAGLCRTMVVANTGGTFALLIIFMLGGFIIPKPQIKPWWLWGYWSSPITYAEIAITVNEFLAPQWAKVLKSPLPAVPLEPKSAVCFLLCSLSELIQIVIFISFIVTTLDHVTMWQPIPNRNRTLGQQVLFNSGLPTQAYWYWIGVAALVGYVILFYTLYTLALTYLNRKSFLISNPFRLPCFNSFVVRIVHNIS